MADNTQIQLIRERIDQVLLTRRDELYDHVLGCVADVLAIDKHTIKPGASLIDDLGAESLDFLDLVFRLETDFHVKIPRDGIRQMAQEGLANGFEQAGVLTPAALDRLQMLMPEVAQERLVTGLRSDQLPNLFTVETFVRLLAWRLAETVDRAQARSYSRDPAEPAASR